MIVFTDNTAKSVSAEQGIAVWNVLNNFKEPENEKQEAFCLRVKRVYLNPANAPASYLQRYPHVPDSYASIMGARNV